jgi:hypothetical protein
MQQSNTTWEPQPTSAPATATPRKRGRKKAADGDADAESTETPAKKGKTSPKKGLGPIPASLISAGLADKMVLRMRDEEGRSWSEITNVWTRMTGIKVEGSTLRKRYTAMKANFVSISAEDVSDMSGLSLILCPVDRRLNAHVLVCL